MNIPFYLVEAFTEKPFQGNVAAVCRLTEWPEDGLLRNMAAQHNQSETAFLVPFGEGFQLRWFTPAMEVDLCGHATLAAAFVLWLTEGARIAKFYTQSGVLTTRREEELFFLDFPARPAKLIPNSDTLARALGQWPT